jgi:hypothetical protein
MSPLRIIDTSYVNVPAATTPPPELIKLSAMEAPWVVFPVLQHVLLFEGADMPTFDAVVQSLRSSLAVTLGSFAPLAGKLVHLKDTGDVAISCSASDTVKFVVAESDTDIRRLVGDEEPDLPVLEQLVADVDMSKLPTHVLAVQATRFEGGVAVGVTVHHAVADGRSLWKFVEAWATACRGETPAATPTFDRSLVKLPGGEERARSIFRELAPNLPSVRFLRLTMYVRYSHAFDPNLPVAACRRHRRRFSKKTARGSAAGHSHWTSRTSNASSRTSSISAKPMAHL